MLSNLTWGKCILILFLKMIELKRTTSDNEDFRLLTGELDRDLWSRYDERQAIYDRYNLVENN